MSMTNEMLGAIRSQNDLKDATAAARERTGRDVSTKLWAGRFQVVEIVDGSSVDLTPRCSFEEAVAFMKALA